MSPLAATTLARSSSLITRVRSAWPSTSPSHIGSRRGGASTSALGRGASDEVEELAAALISPVPQLAGGIERPDRRAEPHHGEPRPGRDIRDGRGPERREIPPHQQHQTVRLGPERRAEPGLGGDHQRPSPERPRTAARRLDQRRRAADPPPQRVAGLGIVDALDRSEPVPQLVVRARRGRERLDLGPQPGQPLGVGTEAAHEPRARREHGLDRGTQEQVVLGRHRVERRAHQPGLDEAAVLEGLGHLGRVEALEPCPQGEVRRRRLLRLEPADGRGGLDDVEPAPLKEVLAREGRAVQRVGRKDRAARVATATRQAPQGIGRTSQTNAIAISPTMTAATVVARIER